MGFVRLAIANLTHTSFIVRAFAAAALEHACAVEQLRSEIRKHGGIKALNDMLVLLSAGELTTARVGDMDRGGLLFELGDEVPEVQMLDAARGDPDARERALSLLLPETRGYGDGARRVAGG